MGCIESTEDVEAFDENNEKLVHEVRKKFAKYDDDDSGVIESSELASLIKDVTGEEMTPLELKRTVKQLDEDEGGTISWLEFKAWFFQDDGTDDQATAHAVDAKADDDDGGDDDEEEDDDDDDESEDDNEDDIQAGDDQIGDGQGELEIERARQQAVAAAAAAAAPVDSSDEEAELGGAGLAKYQTK